MAAFVDPTENGKSIEHGTHALSDLIGDDILTLGGALEFHDFAKSLDQLNLVLAVNGNGERSDSGFFLYDVDDTFLEKVRYLIGTIYPSGGSKRVDHSIEHMAAGGICRQFPQQILFAPCKPRTTTPFSTTLKI